jgi:hypothetical protein
METAAQAAAKALQNAPNALPERATNVTPPMASVPRATAMRRLWSRMTAIYGHKWTAAYGERCDDDVGALTTAGDTWQRGLAGVDERRIGTGLNACLMSADPWPPTLPAFRSMCLSIPTLAVVKLGLRTNRTGFNRLVWQNLDSHLLRQATAERADYMIRDAYELAREHVMSGGALPEVAGIIEAAKPESPKPASPEFVAEHLRKVAEVLADPPEIES